MARMFASLQLELVWMQISFRKGDCIRPILQRLKDTVWEKELLSKYLSRIFQILGKSNTSAIFDGSQKQAN